MKHLKPLGAACLLEAQHFCMTARGVEKQHSIMVTSSLKGVFKDKPETRAEFISLIGK
jgi:GTP cyclohydrolase I